MTKHLSIRDLVAWFSANGYDLTITEVNNVLKAKFVHVRGERPDQDELDEMVEKLATNKSRVKNYLDVIDAWEANWTAWQADRDPAHEQMYVQTYARLAGRMGLPYYGEDGTNYFMAGWNDWANLPVGEKDF